MVRKFLDILGIIVFVIVLIICVIIMPFGLSFYDLPPSLFFFFQFLLGIT